MLFSYSDPTAALPGFTCCLQGINGDMTNAFENISHRYYFPYDNSKGGLSSSLHPCIPPPKLFLFFFSVALWKLGRKKKKQQDLISPTQVMDCSKTNAISGGRWDIFSENKPLNKGQPCFPNTSNPFTKIEECGWLQNHEKKNVMPAKSKIGANWKINQTTWSRSLWKAKKPFCSLILSACRENKHAARWSCLGAFTLFV